MNPDLSGFLEGRIREGGYAYVRNLVAAEEAVRRGQFNLAKVLRAAAHSQRVQALNDGSVLVGEMDAAALLREILTESEKGEIALENGDRRAVIKLDRSNTVRQHLKDLISRSLASVEAHADVMESDVAQSLWGCYGCGYVAEGELPDACPVCGALGPEFEWFGPFYSSSPEHLGQLTPTEVVATLESIPDEVEGAIVDFDDKALGRKPSAEEWSIKEIIGHVLETDGLFAKRVRTILEEPGAPSIDSPVPPWKLQEGKGYEELGGGQLVQRMRQSRATSLDLVRSLSPEQWARRGTLRGAAVTLIDLGTWLANHDRGHLAQIKRE